jgi:Phage integrase family.
MFLEDVGMWKDGELFKLRERPGRCVQASFFWDKGKWISTKQDDLKSAESWARRYVIKTAHGGAQTNAITLGEFADGFFDINRDPQGYLNRMQLFSRLQKQQTLDVYQNYLDLYIMPKFRDRQIATITTLEIEDWYVNVTKVTDRKKVLCSVTRRIILNILSTIMNEAMRAKIVDRNPCNDVTKIIAQTRGKRAFTDDELGRMFPDSYGELMDIWKKPAYALFFSIAADTGWRFSEILPLSKEEFYPDLSAVYTEISYSSHSKRIQKSVKTSTKGGYGYRVGFLSKRSLSYIDMLPKKQREGMWFSSEKGGMITYAAMRRNLKIALEYIGIDPENISIHNFRHTFMSRTKDRISESEALKLMGHTQYRSEYDHSSPEQRIRQVAGVKNKVVFDKDE